jgi:hypothetical protein
VTEDATKVNFRLGISLAWHCTTKCNAAIVRRGGSLPSS